MRWTKEVNEIGQTAYSSEGGCWIIRKSRCGYQLFKLETEEYMATERTLREMKAWAEIINGRQKAYIGYGE